MATDKPKFDLLVVGASNGGMEAFIKILSGLDTRWHIPIIFALHQLRRNKSLLPEILSGHTHYKVVEPIDKETIKPGHLYVAPPDYHLLVEADKTLSYSYSEPVNYSRPSIDVLFETAATAYGKHLIGVLLTGANRDGALGLKTIEHHGGMTIVQDPATARSKEMPSAAIALGLNKHIIDLDNISSLLNDIN